MSPITDKALLAELAALTAAYRDQCLWFLRPDLVPRDPETALRVLHAIETRADRAGYVKARQLKQWLLQHCNGASVGS